MSKNPGAVSTELVRSEIFCRRKVNVRLGSLAEIIQQTRPTAQNGQKRTVGLNSDVRFIGAIPLSACSGGEDRAPSAVTPEADAKPAIDAPKVTEEAAPTKPS